jgi:hypothetical protein
MKLDAATPPKLAPSNRADVGLSCRDSISITRGPVASLWDGPLMA